MRQPMFKIAGALVLGVVALITLSFIVKALIGMAILAAAFKLVSRRWRGGRYGQRQFGYDGYNRYGIGQREMPFGFRQQGGITPIENHSFGRTQGETIVPVY